MKWIFLAFIALVTLSSASYSACQNPGPAQEISQISNSSLPENSGIDFSRHHKNVFWTLNDANNTPEIFAINTDGKNLGTFSINGSKNKDWEDIAVAKCFDNPGKDCIYIADIGNNKGKRKSFNIYVVEEPSTLNGAALSLKETISVTVNGVYNFESFSVNEKTQEFYFVSKRDKKLKAASILFSLGKGSSELKAIATFDFSKFSQSLDENDMTVTSGDFHSASQTLLIGTYGKAFEISLSDIKSFNSKAKIIEIPRMEKAEAIAYSENEAGLSIFTSSEGIDQPLYQISCQ